MSPVQKNSGTVVQCTPYSAKVKKVGDVSPYLNRPHHVVNPDLSKLLSNGVHPKYWKISDGKVVIKSPQERADVDAYYARQAEMHPPKWAIYTHSVITLVLVILSIKVFLL